MLDPENFDPDACVRQLKRRGYIVIENFLSPLVLRAVRKGLAPHLGRHHGRNNFEGHLTERIYTLVARGALFARLAMDARLLAVCDRLLDPGYLLTASQAICIHPGETPQPIHFDDAFYPIPRPRPAISISSIVAVDEFTADNGGTQIIPGSHRWSDAQLGGVYDCFDAQTSAPPGLEAQLKTVRMPAGACLLFLGTLLHRGGANASRAPRLAFSNQWCQPWARPQENFFLGVPRERVRKMPPRLRQLLGYSIHPPFMGHVNSRHPDRALRKDWRALQ